MKTVLAALAALSFAASASAATDENPFAKDNTILQLGGLDLSTADGQQRLAIRMDQAARAVCGERLYSVALSMEAQSRECQAEVIADIRNQIENRREAMADTAKVRLASR